MAEASKTRVLLVDDSKLMRMAAQKMLKDEFDVVTGVDGEDGWRQIEADTGIQVVFTDLSMPKLDGYGLLRRIRTHADIGIHNMPVIIITGAENDEAARAKVLEQGATDFITKPFNSTDLLARARAHANYQRVTKQLQENSTVDPLTGLVNRAGLMERLEQDLAFAQRHRQPLGFARLEIDDFKSLFMKYGKGVGDSLVVHASRIIRSRIRREDTAARVGLASFALSLPTSDLEGTRLLAERIRREIGGQAFKVAGEAIRVRLSAACLAPAPAGLTATGLFDQAQGLLEQALGQGGDRSLGPDDLRRPAAEAPEAALQLDPLLDQLARGETAAVQAQLPRVLERLRPLLALLGPEQRAALARQLAPEPAAVED